MLEEVLFISGKVGYLRCKTLRETLVLFGLLSSYSLDFNLIQYS